MKRLISLMYKELLQMRRDPSSFLLAFVLPVALILLFGFCVNMDSSITRVAVVIGDESPAMHRLVERLYGSPNIRAQRVENRDAALDLLQRGDVHGALIIPVHASNSAERNHQPELMVATDGSVPSTAQFTAMYLQSVCQQWWLDEHGGAPIDVRISYRYNPAADSRNYIVPGAVSMVLSMVGIFLTAMVVAREWERGSIESLLATPMSRVEFVLSKLLPYFLPGLGAMSVCVLCAVWVFDVPLRGSVWLIFSIATLFLCSVLCMGLLISTIVRNQYSASLLSMMIGLLPTMLLSGFVFELSSMPAAVETLSYFIPARYLCSSITPLFLAGENGAVLSLNCALLVTSACFWFSLVLFVTPKRLDS